MNILIPNDLMPYVRLKGGNVIVLNELPSGLEPILEKFRKDYIMILEEKRQLMEEKQGEAGV